MFKDFLALYVFLRILDDVTESPPQNDDQNGCGCILSVILLLVAIYCYLKN